MSQENVPLNIFFKVDRTNVPIYTEGGSRDRFYPWILTFTETFDSYFPRTDARSFSYFFSRRKKLEDGTYDATYKQGYNTALGSSVYRAAKSSSCINEAQKYSNSVFLSH